MSTENVPPLIAAQLNYLLNHFPLPVKIEQMWSGSNYYPGILDRITLVVPYCLDFLKWDLIYDAELPMRAPDVIFGAEDETFHQFVARGGEGEGEGNLKSSKNCLSDWSSKDPTRLMVLVQQLRDLYMSYQRRRVGEVDDDRVKFEISTIVYREGIEMHMSSGVEKAEEVKFSVPLLDMNLNKMVPGCPWRHLQKIYLQVVYPVGKKYVSTPSPPPPRLKLVSTSELKTLFSIEEVKLPPWLDGMCMAEYLPHLEESLDKQVLEAVSLIDVRRRFIEALALPFGRPIEADPVFCRRATVLSASGVFTFLVHFFISTQFPKQQPTLMLQSSQDHLILDIGGVGFRCQLDTSNCEQPTCCPLLMDAGQSTQSKGTRRTWTRNEEEALLRLLDDAVANGGKCENGTFRAGTLKTIEKRLQELYPDCGLKVNPHIESKMRKWKKDYGELHKRKQGKHFSHV